MRCTYPLMPYSEFELYMRLFRLLCNMHVIDQAAYSNLWIRISHRYDPGT